MQLSRMLRTMILLLVVSAAVICNKKPKYKLPRKNVEFEVVKKAIKTELDLTPITDFYALQGTDLSVRLNL